MTEEEYIVVGDLAKIQIAEKAIRDVLATSNPCVAEVERAGALKMVSQWARASHKYMSGKIEVAE